MNKNILCYRCGNKAGNLDKDLCDCCFWRHSLYDLLAIIHRDGGAYTQGNGVHKSIEDANEIIANTIVR